MKQQLMTITAISMLAVGLTACDSTMNAPGGNAATTPSPTVNKADVESRIKEKFKADANLNAANLGVDLNMAGTEITLTGKVESQALRARAVEVAKSVQPNLVINDKIDVEPREVSRTEYTEERAKEARQKAAERGEQVGDSLDDAWIHTKVVAKLIGNSETPQRKINVDVKANVVTLRGIVDTAAEKTEAERVAKETEGVKRVVNQLKIKMG